MFSQRNHHEFSFRAQPRVTGQVSRVFGGSEDSLVAQPLVPQATVHASQAVQGGSGAKNKPSVQKRRAPAESSGSAKSSPGASVAEYSTIRRWNRPPSGQRQRWDHRSTKRKMQHRAIGDEPDSSEPESERSDSNSLSDSGASNASESDSNSEAEDSWTSETDNDSLSTTAVDPKEQRFAPDKRSKIIYFRTSSLLSEDKQETIKQFLRADVPDALVLVEVHAPSNKTSLSDRPVLNDLMQRVFQGLVSKVLLESSAHVCNTKDAFQLFSWVCGQFGASVTVDLSLRLP